ATRSSEKVKCLQPFDVQAMLKNVEQTFFRNIRCGPCMGHLCRRIEFSSTMFTSYDAHRARSLSDVKKCAGYSCSWGRAMFQLASGKVIFKKFRYNSRKS